VVAGSNPVAPTIEGPQLSRKSPRGLRPIVFGAATLGGKPADEVFRGSHRSRSGTFATSDYTRLVLSAESYPLPPTGVIRTSTVNAVTGGCFTLTSAQTKLNWSWLPKAGPSSRSSFQRSGTEPADRLLDGLLGELQGTWKDGCPNTSGLTAALESFSFPGVSHRDGSATLGGTQRGLAEQLRTWACQK
jgi:hypothetical protein